MTDFKISFKIYSN